jgi:hypothetical protein
VLHRQNLAFDQRHRLRGLHCVLDLTSVQLEIGETVDVKATGDVIASGAFEELRESSG